MVFLLLYRTCNLHINLHNLPWPSFHQVPSICVLSDVSPKRIENGAGVLAGRISVTLLCIVFRLYTNYSCCFLRPSLYISHLRPFSPISLPFVFSLSSLPSCCNQFVTLFFLPSSLPCLPTILSSPSTHTHTHTHQQSVLGDGSWGTI